MPEGREWRFLIGGLVAADLATYGGALVAAARLLAQPGLGVHISQQYLLVIVLALPVAAIIFASHGLYDVQNLFGGTREYAAVLRSCVYGVVVLIVLSFAIHLPISREWTVLSGALTTLAVGLARFGARRFLCRLRSHGLFTTRALLVGADAQAVAAVRQLGTTPGGTELVGVLDDYLPMGTVVAGNLTVLGPSAYLTEVASRTAACEVIVVPEALPWESLQVMLARATLTTDRLRVHLVGGLYDLLAAGVVLSERNGIPLLTVKKAALTPVEAVLKRSLDCLLSVTLLVLLAPVWATEMLRLRLRGSAVLERRPVLGRNGQPFDLLNFPPEQATRSVLMRKLPSLLNVIAGQLSIVGPRPIPTDDPKAGARSNPFALRPGLTGLWRQVEDPNEQSLLDLYYVRSYSIWLDLQVLFGRLKARLRIRRPAGLATELATANGGRWWK